LGRNHIANCVPIYLKAQSLIYFDNIIKQKCNEANYVSPFLATNQYNITDILERLQTQSFTSTITYCSYI